MKSIILLLTLTVAQLSVADVDFYNQKKLDNFKKVDLAYEYELVFKVIKIAPVCPKTGPGQLTCTGYGTLITIEAPLNGCLDELYYFNYDSFIYNDSLHIQIDAKANFNKDSLTALCIKIPTIIKTILVPYIGFKKAVKIEKF
jgi:hypothetical protein